MSLLSRLLGDRNPLASHSLAEGPAEHIARALAAAGLDRKRQQAGVRATIEHALGSVGLHARAAAPEAASPLAAARSALGAHRGRPEQGQFLHATFGNAHGRRDYRLYLPVGYDAAGPARPLILMLHGCTQSAEDFAIGTRMNAFADRHGFLVAYPQQIGKANHAKCWNWFRPEDQRGDTGEPSILAGIVRQAGHSYRVDTERVFVAGLSAGAAMAVVLGRTHPDLIRAVGVHSGLPYASANDVPSALAAMQGRTTATRTGATQPPAPPMILFHGDEDRTVVPSNADAIAASVAQPGQRSWTETGRASAGRAYTRQLVVDDRGRIRLERWTVHGAGHAWSGGDPAGSYTDPVGPDASAAMVDFFLRLDGVAGDARARL